jgi:hypothetical protein
MFFLCDVLAEFAKVRLKNGVFDTTTKLFVKSGNKKPFAFTNKHFAKTLDSKNLDYSRSFSPKSIARRNKTNLNKYDYAALDNHISKQWLLPHTIKDIHQAQINQNLEPINEKLTQKLHRMGRVKTEIALKKLESNDKNKPRVLTRYLKIPNKELPAFLASYDPKVGRNVTPYSTTEKGNIRFKNNLATGMDDPRVETRSNASIDYFAKRHVPDSTVIRYMVKSKKKSKGKSIGAIDPYSNEQEVLFPKSTRYKIKHVKKSPFEASIGSDQYNIRLDEI